ncbi:MAG TPA: chorismate-binding protein, partial [Armatimonadota bacterium]|nr:chorismate-binding protein [Armatimonadota bacterium]
MIASPIDPLPIASLASGRHLCYFDGEAGWSGVWWDPVAVFRSKDGRGSLSWSDGRDESADGDPFALLAALLRTYPLLTACGYWGYDLRYGLERLPRRALDDLGLPDCWIGLYSDNSAGPLAPSVTRAHPGPAARTPTPHGELQDSLPRPEYQRAVRRVLEYIAAGDCYQVNLSRRITAPLAGSPWELYRRLRHVSPAPYSAFLDCGDHQVLSSSPELFLRVEGRDVETRPIKGTRPRGGS